jgi:hypothetical protein
MITKEQALEIARQECIRRGWPFEERVRIETTRLWPFRKVWWVKTNLPSLGKYVGMYIDFKTGEVIKSGIG